MSKSKIDKKELRKLFPITEKYVYLDHAGVAPVNKKALEAAEKFLKSASGHAGFHYNNWLEQVEEVRKNFAELIASEPEEIAFVRNTSHGISLVAGGIDWNEGDSVIVYEKTFPANIYPWLNLESRGVKVKFIKSDEAVFKLTDIEKLVDSSTRLISISSVEFTSGYRIDLESLGNFCRGNGIYFFVDAIQTLGIVPMDVKRYNIDFLAADGHKWLVSPEGSGIFYCSNNVAGELNPLLLGWKSIVNEFEYEKIDFSLKTNALKFEEGSLSILGIMALGASLQLLQNIGIDNVKNEIQRLGDLIINMAKQRGFTVRTPADKELRGGAVSFRGDFDPDFLKEKLGLINIMVNSRGGGLRVAPHIYNTDKEINILFNEIDNILDDL
jgi:selenocysteine lyase/cysteine desulfurase